MIYNCAAHSHQSRSGQCPAKHNSTCVRSSALTIHIYVSFENKEEKNWGYKAPSFQNNEIWIAIHSVELGRIIRLASQAPGGIETDNIC